MSPQDHTPTPKAKQDEVLQLLKGWREFFTPFGGAPAAEKPPQDRGNFGPAGLIFAGAEFNWKERELLKKSFTALKRALYQLQNERLTLYSVLEEPYLSDVADHSIVEDRREKVAELDEENAQARSAGKPERVALEESRLFLELHDRAIKILAKYLRDEDLHPVYARHMTEEEENQSARREEKIVDSYLKALNSKKHPQAVEQAAKECNVTERDVERVLEFRSKDKPSVCTWEGCEEAPEKRNLCQKHYSKKRRKEEKAKSA